MTHLNVLQSAAWRFVQERSSLRNVYSRSRALNAPFHDGRRLGHLGATHGCLRHSVGSRAAAFAVTSRHNRAASDPCGHQSGVSGAVALCSSNSAQVAAHPPASGPPCGKPLSAQGRGITTVTRASGSFGNGSEHRNGSAGSSSDSNSSWTPKTAANSNDSGAGSGSGLSNGSPSVAVASAAVAASVAAAAMAGAVASAAPPPPPHATALGFLRRVMTLLRSNFLAVLSLYAIKDGVAFLLHRVTQRLTNHAAEVLLGAPTSTGNPWWLYLDPAFIRANPGYEVLIGLFFLASLPLTIALNSLAFTTTALICAREGQRTGPDDDSAAISGASSASASPSASLNTSPPRLSGSVAATTPLPSTVVRRGVGGSLHLPPDDPAAAALADLGIHALPTAPPPPSSVSRHLPSDAGGNNASATSSSSVTAAATITPSQELGGALPSVSMISAATSLAATPRQLHPEAEAEGTGATPPSREGGPWNAVRAAAASVAAALPAAGRAFRRVWWVDLQFNARALPLQGLCLLVLPALWAVPRLMRIQMALPAAILEARSGRDALNRSSSLMTSSLVAYGWPFAALLAAGRLLEYVQGMALVLIPPRWWREVVEVPLLIAGAFLLLKASVQRLQDLLPLAAFLELTDQEADAARKLQEQVLLVKPPPASDHSEPDADNQHGPPQQQQQPHGRG